MLENVVFPLGFHSRLWALVDFLLLET